MEFLVENVLLFEQSVGFFSGHFPDEFHLSIKSDYVFLADLFRLSYSHLFTTRRFWVARNFLIHSGFGFPMSKALAFVGRGCFLGV